MIHVNETWEEFAVGCAHQVCEIDAQGNPTRKCSHRNCRTGMCLEKKYCPRVAQPKPAREAPPWRASLDAYRATAQTGYNEIMDDQEWLAAMAEKYPYADVKKTIANSYTQYWSTEFGWKNKKQRSGTQIDWRRTYEFPLTKRGLYVPRDAKSETWNARF